MQIALILLAALAALIIFISLRPSEFRVTRSASMTAPPSKIFDEINNLRNWNDWSPWAKLDPNAQNVFEGPDAGTGAVFKWSGNNKVGAGIMTIIDSRPDELVRLRLEFLKPFKGISTSEFTLARQGDMTLVTWTMLGKNNFMAKAMSLFMNCEKIVGTQFEQGLASMKAIAETG